MDIGIVGTFDVENYGDLVFPLIAEFELRERLGDVTMHCFSYHGKTPPDWPYAVTSVADLPELMGQLDGLLIGGGHVIRFDKHIAPGYAPSAPHIHHPTGYWLTPALVAHEHGRPVIWNAPGVLPGEIPTWAVPLLKLTLELTSYLSVRDEPSKAALARFVDGDRIDVIPDTAFGISRLLGAGTAPTKPYIVIQPPPAMAFRSFVKAHADRFAEYQLLALPIQPVQGDDPEVVADLPGIVRLPAWPQPLPLAEIVSNASAVVGDSYHLAITALSAGVPVFTSADLGAGKFTALREHGTIHRLVERELNLEWFFSRLAKTAPAALLRDRFPVLAKHWRRLAAKYTALVEACESDPDWFFSRLGKTAPAALLRDRFPVLAKHWRRLAAKYTALVEACESDPDWFFSRLGK